MIADGAIRGVQIRRGCPIDRLLHAYYETVYQADILNSYLDIVPPTKEKIALMDDMLKSKYPFYKKDRHVSGDILDRYNAAMKLAKQIEKQTQEKKGG